MLHSWRPGVYFPHVARVLQLRVCIRSRRRRHCQFIFCLFSIARSSVRGIERFIVRGRERIVRRRLRSRWPAHYSPRCTFSSLSLALPTIELENSTARVIYPVESALSFYYSKDCDFSTTTTTTTLESKKEATLLCARESRRQNVGRGSSLLLVLSSRALSCYKIAQDYIEKKRKDKKSEDCLGIGLLKCNGIHITNPIQALVYIYEVTLRRDHQHHHQTTTTRRRRI